MALVCCCFSNASIAGSSAEPAVPWPPRQHPPPASDLAQIPHDAALPRRPALLLHHPFLLSLPYLPPSTARSSPPSPPPSPTLPFMAHLPPRGREQTVMQVPKDDAGSTTLPHDAAMHVLCNNAGSTTCGRQVGPLSMAIPRRSHRCKLHPKDRPCSPSTFTGCHAICLKRGRPTHRSPQGRVDIARALARIMQWRTRWKRPGAP